MYAEYLMRAARQSARTLELYQEVMDCVTRNELAPTVLQDMMAAFMQARGTDYTNKMAEIATRFFGDMVQFGTAYADEMAELVLPGSSLPPIPPAAFDMSDPTRWYQQISDYAGELSARAAQVYGTVLEHVAAGEVTPGRFQELSAQYSERRLPQHLQRLGALYFDVLNALNDLRAAYEEEYLTGVLATARRANQGTDFALDLVGPLGGVASASVALTNTNPESAVVQCSTTEVRRADGVGPAFDPNMTISPNGLRLRPGEEVSVALSLRLDEGRYEPGALYVGVLNIAMLGESRLNVPLRIKATAADPAERVPAEEPA